MRIGVHDLFCGRPFETPGFSVTKFYNQCRGSGSDRKFKVAVEGIKFTTGFWRYRPKRLLFELASRKSRTLGGRPELFDLLKTWEYLFVLADSILCRLVLVIQCWPAMHFISFYALASLTICYNILYCILISMIFDDARWDLKEFTSWRIVGTLLDSFRPGSVGKFWLGMAG